MPRPYRNILIISFVLMVCCFVHDYIYDKPSTPYTLWQSVVEFVIIGSMYTAIFFAVIAGLYYVIDKLFGERG